MAVITGSSAADSAQQSLPEGETFNPDSGGTTTSGVSTMTHNGGCPHSGTITQGTGSKTVFGGSVTTEVITYGNYVVTCPEGQAEVNGQLETGSSGTGHFYGEFGNPGAADGFFEATVTSSQTSDMYFNMAALVEVCDGCGGTSAAYGLGSPEFQADFFMDATMEFDQFAGTFRFGADPTTPLVIRVWTPGANETVAIDGRIGAEQAGNPCGYDWELDTQTPVAFNNGEAWNGSVIVSDPADSSTSHTVTISSGQVSVDGQVISDERKQQIAQNCGF